MKRKNKALKRLLALTVSASLILSMSVPTFALDSADTAPPSEPVAQNEQSQDEATQNDVVVNGVSNGKGVVLNASAAPQKESRAICLHWDWSNARSTWETQYTVREATCTEKAIVHQKCSKCNAERDKEVGELGHVWSTGDDIKVITKPTCVAIGTGYHYCKKCDASKLDLVDIPALGHEWYITKDAVDIGSIGSYDTDVSHTVKCRRCKIVATSFHKYNEATCTEPEKCDCGHVKLDSKPLGHDYSKDWSKDETNHWHECNRCGDKKDEAAHVWDDGKVTKQPTDTENGVKTFTCTTCGQTKTEALVQVVWYDGYNDTHLKAEVVSKSISDEAIAKLYPKDPTREDYKFNGWNVVHDNIGNVTITATWFEDKNNNGVDDSTEARYTVAYTDGVDDEEIFANQVYGDLLEDTATPAFNGTPTRENYTFVGWTPVLADKVTGNITYTAVWQVQTATVRWVNYDGTVLAEDTFDKDPGAPDADTYEGETPTRPNSDGVAYRFEGWSDAEVDENGNVTYTAVYNGLTINPPLPPETATPTTGGGATVAGGAAGLVAVADGATPLANVDADNDLTEIKDEDTPLSKGSEGHWSLMNLILAIFTALTSVLMLVAYARRKGDSSRKGIFGILSVVPAIAAVVLFAMKSDMSLSMVMTDEWTLLMAVFALVNVVFAFLSKKNSEETAE